MTYWLGVAGVLLIGYVLIKVEEKANDYESKGNGGGATGAIATDLGVRATATLATTTQAGNAGENEGNNGGEE